MLCLSHVKGLSIERTPPALENALRLLEENRSLELKTELLKTLGALQSGDIKVAENTVSTLLDAIERKSDTWLHRKWNAEIESQAGALSLLQLSEDAFYEHLLKLMLDGLNRAQTGTDPFPHFVIDPVFDVETYVCMLLSAPHITHLKPVTSPEYLKNGRYQRYQSSITPNAFQDAHRRVRFVWFTLDRVMKHPEVIALLCQKLSLEIPGKYKVHTRLQIDRAGCRIRPHLDGENGGLLTYQMYFPLNKSNFDTGTALFKRQGDAFQTIRKMQYKPNLANAFRIGRDSWHGSEKPLPNLAGGRLSFLARIRAEV